MTVLITGATSGLGRELAREFAARDVRLLLHGREAGRLAELAAEVGAARTYLADFADLDQVRAMAAGIRAAEPRLDVLVNNAAIGGGTEPGRRQTGRQGHELRFTVNHLAPYVLTTALAPLLAASAPARVVNVASEGQAPVDFTDVGFERGYDGVQAYCRSKLALIMSTFDLADRLAADGVTGNALHPAALMDTAMIRQSGFTAATTVADGAAPVVRLATDPALAGVTGRYFDRFDDAAAHPQAYDPDARAALGALTRELVRA